MEKNKNEHASVKIKRKSSSTQKIKFSRMEERLKNSTTEEEILEIITLMKKSDKNRFSFRAMDKKKHSQILFLRNEMLDWVSQVADKLNQSDETVFLCMEILDKILEMFKYNLNSDELHLSLITSLFIASKNIEIDPIKLDTIANEVGHKKFDKKSILNTEILILKKLNFKMPKNNFSNFVNIVLNKNYPILENTEKDNLIKYKQLIFDYSKKVYKMMLFSHPLCYNIKTFIYYSSIILFSILEIDLLIKSPFLLLYKNFSKNVMLFRVKSDDLLFNLTLIKEQRKILEDNKDYFPYVINTLEKFTSCVKIFYSS